MGQIKPPASVMPIVAVTTRHAQALTWFEERAAGYFGAVAARSAIFPFTATDYYTPSMGEGLQKQFVAFARLADPARLVDWKVQTNEWEAAYASWGQHAEARPLNLDPGYLTLGKLVLASTKDHAHRIYLARGIYAEVTLYFHAGHWQPRDWTFPDYRQAAYHEFFDRCRTLLRQAQKAGPTP